MIWRRQLLLLCCHDHDNVDFRKRGRAATVGRKREEKKWKRAQSHDVRGNLSATTTTATIRMERISGSQITCPRYDEIGSVQRIASRRVADGCCWLVGRVG